MTTAGATTIRLVIIDDEPDIRALTRLQCEFSTQVEVVGDADNGTNGLALIEQTLPDVAVIDLMMPGIDGVQLIRLLRDSGTSVRLVAYSADRKALELAADAGADATVIKTGDFEDLIAMITHVT